MTLIEGLRNMIERGVISADTAPDDFDWLTQTLNATSSAVVALRCAMGGDSNDDEHDKAFELCSIVSDIDTPECDCSDRSWYGDDHDSACPVTLLRNTAPEA